MPANQKAVDVSLVLNSLAATIEDTLSAAAGERIGFVLVLTVAGTAQYISNGDRADGIAILKSLLTRWEAGRADIPAHYNPDL
jgi:hypothetical protein